VTDPTEALQTGYGPGTPPGDNVCNDFVRESADSFAGFARARGDRVERVDGIVTMTDAGSPLPFFNRAMLEQPPADLDSVLQHVRGFYGSAGGGSPFLFDSAWPTPDLRPRGFALMGHPPLIVRPAMLPLPPPPPELRVVEIGDDHTAHDFEHVLVYGYPAPQLQPLDAVTVMTPGARTAAGWRHFVGYVEARPVVAGSAYVGAHLLRVENIAAMDDVRGRGYGRAITAAAIAVDLTKPATLVASDLGRPVYERLGFVAMQRITYWVGVRS